MALGQASLVSLVRRELDDEPYEDVLTAAYTAGSGSVSVGSPTQLSRGDVLELPDGNQLLVKATPSANPVSVKGGHNDTTDTSASSGAVVLVNPEFPYVEITAAIERAAQELWPWVWKTVETTITLSATERYYALPADFERLISATQDITAPGGPKRVLVYGSRGSGYPVSVVKHVPTTIAASGKALYVPRRRTTPSVNLVVRYVAQITTTVSSGSYTDFPSDPLFQALIVRGACAELLEDVQTVRLQGDVEQGDVGAPAEAPIRNAAWHRRRFEELRRMYALRLQQAEEPARIWER